MLLLVINIAIIYLFGILTFMVKRVYPGTEYDKRMYMTRSQDFNDGTLVPTKRESDGDLLSKSPHEDSSQLNIAAPTSPRHSPKQRTLCVPTRFGRKNNNEATQPLRLNDAGAAPIIL